MDKIISPDKSRTASRTVSRDSFILEDLNDFGETPEAAMNNLIYGNPKIPIDFESFRRSNEDFQVVRQVHSFDSIEFRDRGKHTISLQKQQQFGVSNSPKKFGESLASDSTATIGEDYDVNSRKHVINLLQPKDPKQKEDPKKSFSPSFPIMRAYSDDTQNNAVYHSDSIDSTATEHQFERSKREVKPQEEYLVSEQMALQADIEMFNNEEKRAARTSEQTSFLLSSEFDEQRKAAAAQQEQRERKNSFNSLYNLDQQSPAQQQQQQQQGQQQQQQASQSNKVTSSQDFSSGASNVSPAGPSTAANGAAARRQPSPVTGPPGLNMQARSPGVSASGAASMMNSQQQQYDSNAYGAGSGVAFDTGYGQPQPFLGSDLGRYDQQQQQGLYAQPNGALRGPVPNSQMPSVFGGPRPQIPQFTGLGAGVGGGIGMEYDARGLNYGSPTMGYRPSPQGVPMPQANLRGGYAPAPAAAMGPAGLSYGAPPQAAPAGSLMGRGYLPQPGPAPTMGMAVPANRLGPYVSPLTGMGGDQRYGPPSAYPPRAPMGGQFPQSMGMGAPSAGYYGATNASMPGPAYGSAANTGAPYGLGAGPFATGPYVSPFSGMGAAAATAGPYGLQQQQTPYGTAPGGFGGAGPMHSNPNNSGGAGGGGRGKYGYGSNRATNTNNLISAGLYDGTGTVYVVQLKCQYRHYVLDPRAPTYLKIGDFVIVDADRGEDLGIIIELLPMMSFIERQRMLHISLDDEQNEVGRILRQASMYEREQLPGKYQDELLVIETTEQLALNTYHMQMIVVDADYQFDRQKLTIYYDSAIRVDFRELVRDLFATFKTRIWFKKANNRYFKAKQYAVMGLATGQSPVDLN